MTAPLKPETLRERVPLGNAGRVFRALAPDGRPVVLKLFTLQRAGSWKELELFTREAEILRQLDHPRLPRLLAWSSDPPEPWLISAWIPGESLEARLASGWRPDEAAVRALARQLLELLICLHGQQPPIVHRDIKPANLVLAEDDSLSLIDFGSVLLRLNPDGGSTVAGTFGYMAPEQLTGRASPASDLYGVGATLVHLLSGRAPAELPQERLRIAFESYVNCSPALSHWLQRLLAPMPEDRFASAATALQALDAPALPPALLTAPPIAAAGRPLSLRPVADGIEVVLPPRGLAPERLNAYLWRRGLLRGGPLLALLLPLLEFEFLGQPLFFGVLYLTLIWWCWLRERAQYRALTAPEWRLRFSADELQIEQQLDGRARRRSLRRSEVTAVRRETTTDARPEHGGVRLQSRYAVPHELSFVRLGQTLDADEQDWLCDLLQEWKADDHG